MSNLNRAVGLYEQAKNLEMFDGRFSEGIYFSNSVSATFLMIPGEKGIRIMTESAECGYAPAQYALGIYYLFECDHRELAFSDIEDKCEQYKQIAKLQEDERKIGLMWMRKAAEQSFPEACLVLGDFFLKDGFGNAGIERNYAEAFKYYCKGANYGNVEAMYCLGRCHYHGWGTSENNDKAFDWFCKARDSGCELMWTQLGECYMNGYGTEKNIPEAINAFENELKLSNPEWKDTAYLNLSIIYAGIHGFQYANFQKAYLYANVISKEAGDYYKKAQDLLQILPDAEAKYAEWKQQNQKKKGGCYVATAVYGSYDCPQVWTLRRFRDKTLAVSWYGRTLIRLYYAVSPTLVKWFGDSKCFSTFCKPRLDRLVAKLNENGVADTPYQD